MHPHEPDPGPELDEAAASTVGRPQRSGRRNKLCNSVDVAAAVVCGSSAGMNSARLGGSTQTASSTPWFRSSAYPAYRAGMPMNAIHRRLCRSDYWANLAHSQLLPWALRGVPLDGEVLEIGPGYGVTTRWLAERAGRLTAIEIDPELVAELRAEFAGRVEVRRGDGAALPFADASFDTVVCFTMLHHVPSAQQQDRLFAEAARVLRPGGMFAGSDSRLSLRFRFVHIGDTMVAVDPDTLPDRLRLAGLTDTRVELGSRSLRFTATRPLR